MVAVPIRPNRRIYSLPMVPNGIVERGYWVPSRMSFALSSMRQSSYSFFYFFALPVSADHGSCTELVHSDEYNIEHKIRKE